MDAFGDEVTKTLFIEQGKTDKTEILSKENHATKMMKKPKTKLPKFVMSRAHQLQTDIVIRYF